MRAGSTRPTSVNTPSARRAAGSLPGSIITLPCGLHLEHWQRVKLPAEDLERGEIEPLVEQRRIDAPEIDRPLEVAVLQIAEQRRFADKTGLYARPGEEDRTGRAVIGAERPVLIGPAAE